MKKKSQLYTNEKRQLESANSFNYLSYIGTKTDSSGGSVRL